MRYSLMGNSLNLFDYLKIGINCDLGMIWEDGLNIGVDMGIVFGIGVDLVSL
jgi:hypothetical protein